MAAIDSRISQIQVEERRASAYVAFWRLADVLRWSVGAAAVLYICGYVLAALLRMRYPFEIGFMDGNFLVQLERVLHGQPLFTAPSLSYTPMVYAPLYFYVSAIAAKLVGFGMAPLRLVSFLASLGSFAILYRFVLRETASWYCALVSVGLYAATYRETSYAFDLATTDSLYIFLLVSGAYLLRWRRDAAWLALAGALTGLSFLTKQTALIIALPFAAYAATLGRRAFLAYAGAAAAIGGGGVALLHLATGGWSTVYMFSAISTIFTAWRMFGLFWARDVFLVLPIAALFCAMYFLDPISYEHRRPAWFYGCFGAGTFAAGWLYTLNWGAGTGGRIPPYFFLCLLTGLGLGRVLGLLAAHPGKLSVTWGNVLFAALVIQFWALLYNPFQVVPRKADVEAGRQVVATIAQFPGPVFVPNHPYLPVLAGKPAFADMMNLRFVLKAKNQRAVEPLRAELREAFRQKKFSAVLVDADWTHELLDDEFRADLLENYVQSGEIPYADNTLFRITASVMMVRPQFIYLPQPQPQQ
jgi:hypothetical protein